MSALKGLQFTTFVLPQSNSRADPKLKRRQKVLARLEDQKKLLANPEYTRTVRKKNKEGAMVERHQKIRPCWYDTGDGCVFVLKAGFQPVEFQKNKSAILVGDKRELAKTIDVLIQAVNEGALDEQLKQASEQTRTKLKRKAA